MLSKLGTFVGRKGWTDITQAQVYLTTEFRLRMYRVFLPLSIEGYCRKMKPGDRVEAVSK